MPLLGMIGAVSSSSFGSGLSTDGGGAAASQTDYSGILSLIGLGTNIDWFYTSMPSGPRTMQNYIQSFGKSGASVNDGSTSWNNGHATLARVDVYGWHSYFNYGGNDGNIRIFRGDGGYDSNDWAVFDFYHLTNGDFAGNVNNSAGRYSGGEYYSGGSGGNGNFHNGTSRLRLWGFSASGGGWNLLYEHGMSSSGGGSHSNQNGHWYSTGNTVSSGQGKRAAYDTLAITAFGFTATTQ